MNEKKRERERDNKQKLTIGNFSNYTYKTRATNKLSLPIILL